MGFGDYPNEYNPKVHGVYDPSRYYGKPDVPLGQVKINELENWFKRRNMSPSAIAGVVSRAWWKWQHKYMQPKRSTMAPYYQLLIASIIFTYSINYGKIKEHRNYKYH